VSIHDNGMSKRDARFALVTGANRGLGLETCRKLAARGWQIGLTSRDPRSGEKAARELRAESAEVKFFPLNVADVASIRALAAHAREAWPPIDALVNNAGVLLDRLDAANARRTLDTNFYGPMRLTDEISDRLVQSSNVVMVSSGMGDLSGFPAPLRARFADPALTRERLVELVEAFIGDVASGTLRRSGWPSDAYRVSKAALNALTRLLAEELAPRGIHVNAVCPGWVRTDMGGAGAPRSIDRGAEGIAWAAALGPDGPSGGYFRDGHPIEW
jgi:NAD(P)-dependent dehydrogenase (short-subunit alcohol dehydrogenase family)